MYFTVVTTSGAKESCNGKKWYVYTLHIVGHTAILYPIDPPSSPSPTSEPEPEDEPVISDLVDEPDLVQSNSELTDVAESDPIVPQPELHVFDSDLEAETHIFSLLKLKGQSLWTLTNSTQNQNLLSPNSLLKPKANEVGISQYISALTMYWG